MGLFDEYFEKHRLNEPQTPECINTRKATNHIKAHLFHVSAAKLHLILRTKEELKDQQFCRRERCTHWLEFWMGARESVPGTEYWS